VSARRASTLATPPAATVVSTSVGPAMECESTRTEPNPNWKSVGKRYPTPAPQKAARRVVVKRV
jgi:hypothetical protein